MPLFTSLVTISVGAKMLTLMPLASVPPVSTTWSLAMMFPATSTGLPSVSSASPPTLSRPWELMVTSAPGPSARMFPK